MDLFAPFPGDDDVALDAAARALLVLPLEWTAAQLVAEPACVYDHWPGTHRTVAFVRPARAARYVRCEYASDHGVYPHPELVADACRRAAVRAFIERFAHAPTRYAKVAYAPMLEARMAPMRPDRSPIVLARATVGVGDDAAAVLVFSAPDFVFGRYAHAVFGALVVAIADVDATPGAPPGRECIFTGCADDADDYALAELVTRLRLLAVRRAGGKDVHLRVDVFEPAARPVAPRPQPIERAVIAATAQSHGVPLLSATASILPLDDARRTYNDLLCDLGRTSRAFPQLASVPLDATIVTAIEPV